ncbi:MAG: protein kinase, partial [Rhodoferax sp.]|nr:protein kinase [Rhodoferax sp.]
MPERPDQRAAPPWSEVEPWFDRALAQPEAQRLAWLRAQGLPPTLLDEVTVLLRAEQDSRGLYAGDDTTRKDDHEAADAMLPAGTRVGAWQVVGPIGRGGSGEVYRVERADGSYQQQAALKLLRMADDADERRRFAAERHTLARLQVPGIVRLLDAGSHDGRPWAVTELVEGQPLDVAGDALDLPARLTLLRRVIGVVATAHAGGVVHRDL